MNTAIWAQPWIEMGSKAYKLVASLQMIFHSFALCIQTSCLIPFNTQTTQGEEGLQRHEKRASAGSLYNAWMPLGMSVNFKSVHPTASETPESEYTDWFIERIPVELGRITKWLAIQWRKVSSESRRSNPCQQHHCEKLWNSVTT